MKIAAEWKVVALAVVLIVALTMAAGFAVKSAEQHAGAANQVVWYAWLLAAVAVGWLVAGKGVLKALLAGAVFGLCAELLYYGAVIVGAYFNVFGVPITFGLVQPVETAKWIAIEAGVGALRSAALAVLGALAAIFVKKMREAG
ncbi:MAG: hypothetical protein WC759_05960 [Candidatus Micrarchaeia archaeon]|jgi:hypothetical protein